MKKTKSGFVIVGLLLAVAFLCIISILGVGKNKLLVIQNNTTGEKTEFYLKDDSFSLGYMHSVMKTPAEEFFRVNADNEIVLEKTVYESFGVGLPFLADKNDFEIKDDKFILYTDSVFKEINMIISPIPEHWLQIGDMKYELTNILKEKNCSITIYSHDDSVMKYLMSLLSNPY
ncbi:MULTISPECIES: DUF1850 domain-containing protein [unclassified Sedimentibacter]|uniref:DUF1850 domain-containing protein n=1 Tax=unclassified Sedimentibacter TaxID=2649220 RepID=UPI0027E00478|nr:DUF1850 domain-containing protein [Sedimentibacter sp. MB35-C1]WMJ78754.1 DUF1850 domain-containing protein [Sedimentibacter sp. MB35-C1]